jgi:ppGpp synthetase/RelA/SpoT-type nucleotidyltranferase
LEHPVSGLCIPGFLWSVRSFLNSLFLGASEMTEQATPDEDSTDPLTDELQVIKDRAHEARIEYDRQRGLYHDFANDIVRVIKTCLTDQKIGYHTITGREKDPDSFERKAAQTSAHDPSAAKYNDPLQQITDKAAVRITTYFLDTVDSVLNIIDGEFDVLERIDKTSSEPDRLGYQSIHYLVQYPYSRTSLSENRRFSGLVAEIQVRTILQHAWAEIEHDIQYKAVAAVPELIRRRFTALAGLIEIADREFQAIATENLAIRTQARINIDAGQLDLVEITRDSLKEYIDKKYGPDGRMREWSYDWAVRLLLDLGFTNLGEVDECISGYDDDAISRIVYGSRLGQLTRFEYVLLASMGEYFILAHPWLQAKQGEWYARHCIPRLRKLQEQGIDVGTYRPKAYPNTRLSLKDLADIDTIEGEAVPMPPDELSTDIGP